MQIKSQSEQKFSVILRLTEDEARGLHDIVGYGYDAFIKVFTEHLGKHYIEQHMDGVKSLFDVCQKELPKHFLKFEEARKLFENTK